MHELDASNCTPIIIQSKNSSFNARIILNETNYDVWSQIIEMHIAEKRETLIYSWEYTTTYWKRWKIWEMVHKQSKCEEVAVDVYVLMKRYIRLPTAQEI